MNKAAKISVHLCIYLLICILLISLWHTPFYNDHLPYTLLLDILPLAAYYIIYAQSGRKKLLGPYVAEELAGLGYVLVNERPLTLREQMRQRRLRVPLQRLAYRSKRRRQLTVHDSNQSAYNLWACIIHHWNDEYELEIEDRLPVMAR